MNLKQRILRSLHRRHYWGAKQTSVENAVKGIPAHALGDAKKAVELLIK